MKPFTYIICDVAAVRSNYLSTKVSLQTLHCNVPLLQNNLLSSSLNKHIIFSTHMTSLKINHPHSPDVGILQRLKRDV